MAAGAGMSMRGVGGHRVMSADCLEKPKLTQKAIASISAKLKTKDAARARNTSTLLSLIRACRSEDPNRPSSPEWERLAANTKKTWGSALNKIEERWSEVPLAGFNDTRMIGKVIDWRDSRASTPRAADNG